MAKAQITGSLTDQLNELIALANKEGLYDAADLVQCLVPCSKRLAR